MDDENQLPSGGGGLFGSSAIAESMSFMGAGNAETAEALTPVDAPVAATSGTPAEPAAETPAEPAAEAAPEAPVEPEVLPKRGGPSPVLREYIKAQEERAKRAEALLEAQRAETAKLLEAVQALTSNRAPQTAEADDEPEEEPLDPLERDLKAMRAKVEAMERAQAEREAQMQQARYERTLQAARNEIVSEVDAVVKEFPELGEFRNEVYANVALNSEQSRIAGSNVKELPVAEIARQFARRLGLVKAKAAPAATPAAPLARPAAAQTKPPTPGSPAPVPRHPSASASVPSAPRDVSKMSFQELNDAWVRGS